MCPAVSRAHLAVALSAALVRAATRRGRAGLKNLGRAHRLTICMPQTSEAGRRELRQAPCAGRVALSSVRGDSLVISSRGPIAQVSTGRARWSHASRISQGAAIGPEHSVSEAADRLP